MLSRLLTSLKQHERTWRRSFGTDISTRAARRSSRWHFLLTDHAILRILWTNFYPVAKGVFRSNQPSPKRLEAYKKRGIKSVLNLRGASPYSHYLFESEACEKLGLPLSSIHLKPASLPSRETILELETHFRTLEKPFVMHCKSGADRAGFASALYLLLIEKQPVEIAARQLSFRYLHIKASKKGIFHYCLEKYRKTNEVSPIGFRDWMLNVYEPSEITAGFKAWRSGGKTG